MLVGGGHGEARQTLKDDRAIAKTTAVQFCVGDRQWNCPSHAVWQQRSECIKLCFAHGGLWTPPLAHVYVLSGRAGGNERRWRLLYFSLEICRNLTLYHTHPMSCILNIWPSSQLHLRREICNLSYTRILSNFGRWAIWHVSLHCTSSSFLPLSISETGIESNKRWNCCSCCLHIKTR